MRKARIIFTQKGGCCYVECLDFNLVGMGHDFSRAITNLQNLITNEEGEEKLFWKVPLVSKIRYYWLRLTNKKRTLCVIQD